jgi:hypothetical protein
MIAFSVPFSFAAGQAGSGKNLAEDFRITTFVQGLPDTMVIMGHVVGTNDKMRIDLTSMGPNAQVSPLSEGGPISMIVTDSGRTITYLDPKRSQYVRVSPADMLAQAQKTGDVKMEFSSTQASVDSLGPGPVMLGHPTLRYRVQTGMTMSMTAFGQAQSAKLSSTTEYVFATDIPGGLNPFSSLSGGDMMNMFGASNKDFADKMKGVQSRLPKKTPLRASSSATVLAQGQTRITNTQGEVTSVQWVNADPKVFDIPASYTAGQLPSIGAPPAAGTAPPPR